MNFSNRALLRRQSGFRLPHQKGNFTYWLRSLETVIVPVGLFREEYIQQVRPIQTRAIQLAQMIRSQSSEVSKTTVLLVLTQFTLSHLLVVVLIPR